jgi:hypothetical protein
LRVLKKRRPVIEWAGELHAYPLARAGAPQEVKLTTPGADEPGWSRVGWKDFFTPIERRNLRVVVDSETELRYRLLPLHLALTTLPREAFGPPWWKALAHEVFIASPAKR